MYSNSTSVLSGQLSSPNGSIQVKSASTSQSQDGRSLFSPGSLLADAYSLSIDSISKRLPERSTTLNKGRVHDKADNKSKHDYFQDRLGQVLQWGPRPAFTTGNSWYACEKNLKTTKNHPMGVVFAVKANRTVSLEKGAWVQVQKLGIPDEGLMVWLRNFGQVKLFWTRLKEQLRRDVVCLPSADADAYATFERESFQEGHDQHWRLELYHRMLKQVCNIERFQVRKVLPY